jgi:Nif-specific regulatory protein
VQNGRFRADLYYRLNVLPIYIPPLRERREDILHLAEFFLKRFNREIKKQIGGFSPAALETLLSYSWPGNVRELENAVERAVVVTQGEVIFPDVFALEARSHGRPDEYGGKSLKEAVNVFKRHYIRQALELNEWNQTKTSRLLGIQRTYLSRLVKELEITP